MSSGNRSSIAAIRTLRAKGDVGEYQSFMGDLLAPAAHRAYIHSCPACRTMEINAHVISRLDPGAIPGGSTKSSTGLSPVSHGADQHRQMCKGVLLSLGMAPPYRAIF